MNLDEFVKTIKTHEITFNGKKYTAKPLSLKRLMEIQKLYNEAEDDALGPVTALFEAVGYPGEDLVTELPVQALMELQTELFLSMQEQTKTAPTKKKKK